MMPVVFRAHGLRFIIYVDDHRPPHIHVDGRGVAKIALEPKVELIWDRGMTKPDVKRALDVVTDGRDEMIKAWNRIHG